MLTGLSPAGRHGVFSRMGDDGGDDDFKGGGCHVLFMFRGSAIWDLKVVGPSKLRWNKHGNLDFSTIYLGGGFKYHPYLGKLRILTNIFQRG